MRIRFIIYILCIAPMLPSCDNLLKEYNPSGLTQENVYTTPDGFESLVNGVYSYTRAWYGKEEGFNLTEMGTDLWLPGIDNLRLDLMTYNNLQGSEARYTSSEASLELLWKASYQAINLCNEGLQVIPQSGLPVALQNTREGELRSLRALFYWLLTEQWGSVHFTTEPTASAITQARRTPVTTIYGQIVEDLQQAIAKLPIETQDPGRITKPVAEALLARVYLSLGNYNEASRLAEKVINEYSFALETNYARIWDMSNLTGKEIVWSVNYTSDQVLNDRQNDINNPNGHSRGGNNGHALFTSAYDRNAAGALGMQRDLLNGRPFVRYMPSQFLLNLFDTENDSRYQAAFKSVWLCNKPGVYKKRVGDKDLEIRLSFGDTAIYAPTKEFTNEVEEIKNYLVLDPEKIYGPSGKPVQNALYIHLNKFSDPTRASTQEIQSARDAFVIRLAEMYLIVAEAEFQTGNLVKATQFLNVIRRRAAKKGKEDAMLVTAAAMNIDFILDERARELAGEQLRWFDLKRTGKLLERVKKNNPLAEPHIQEFHSLRPIPQIQLDALSNKSDFPQNPGYN